MEEEKQKDLVMECDRLKVEADRLENEFKAAHAEMFIEADVLKAAAERVKEKKTKKKKKNRIDSSQFSSVMSSMFGAGSSIASDISMDSSLESDSSDSTDTARKKRKKRKAWKQRVKTKIKGFSDLKSNSFLNANDGAQAAALMGEVAYGAMDLFPPHQLEEIVMIMMDMDPWMQDGMLGQFSPVQVDQVCDRYEQVMIERMGGAEYEMDAWGNPIQYDEWGVPYDIWGTPIQYDMMGQMVPNPQPMMDQFGQPLMDQWGGLSLIHI